MTRKNVLLSLSSLFLLLALTVFPSCRSTLPTSYDSFAWFAITTPNGSESVYAPDDGVFSLAETAFLTAAPISVLPSGARRENALTLDWIKDGLAHRFTLYFFPASLSAVLIDGNGTAFAFTEESAVAFLSLPESAEALVGTRYSLTDGEEEIQPSVGEWTYALQAKNGTPVNLSSGERVFSPAAPVSRPLSAFSPSFAETPVGVEYVFYQNSTEITRTTALPVTLPAGEYQLVVIATYGSLPLASRQGYSLTVTVE